MTAASVEPAVVPSNDRSWVDAGRRPAAITFAVFAVAAVVHYLVIGRRQWFYSDEWDLIVTRSATDPDDLFRPHNGHWVLVPTVLYRFLFRVFGLTSYLPYQVPVVLAFVTSGASLRAIVGRAGAGPWVATLVGALFLTLGSGIENIVFGFQISLVGSVAFGLGALVLVDGDRRARPLAGRGVLARWWTIGDTGALVCAALALLCSGMGITMVAVAALVVVVRRGWLPAVLFTVPLAAMQIAWTLWYDAGDARPGSLGSVVRFVLVGLDETAKDLSQLGTVGVVVVVVLLVGGGVLRFTQDRPSSAAGSTDPVGAGTRAEGSESRGWRATVDDLAVPLALVVGVVGLLVFAAIGRAGPFGPESGRAERYTMVAVAFLLPMLGVAVDAICRRSTPVGVLALAVLVIGAPLNVAVGLDSIERRDGAVERTRSILLALTADPRFDSARDDQHPMPGAGMAPLVTVGWLRQAVDEGWIEVPATVEPIVAAEAGFRLLIDQTVDRSGGPAGACTELPPAGAAPLVVTVEAGDVLEIAGGLVTVTAADPGAPPIALNYNPNRGTDLVIRDGPTQLALTSTGVNGPGELCASP